jgi:hypothetical protein
MIDIEKIKSLPDDKPRKGPARMSKSEKSPAQERWRSQRSLQRRIGPERYAASQAIVREIVDGMDREFLRDLDILPHEVINPEISVAPTDFPILNQKGLKIVNSILENIMED